MSSRTSKDAKKTPKNQPVASRCVAIVFKRTNKINSSENENCDDNEVLEGGVGKSARPVSEARSHNDFDRNFFTLGGDSGNLSNDNVTFDPKKVFEEFKLRNKTCFWNPALVDSVNSLDYVGFLEPLTVLVKGDDIHLENIRTAWGRRVLKDPANFFIDRIGDVNGIEMEVIPQTQFIPLPEALCLIIMDLNNSQIVATLDTVYERLRHCYGGISLPGNQLVYETLGQLIRERKVFHTGCGYFVVTPDTFRMHGEDLSSPTMVPPWTHLHPMYIPSAFNQQPRQPMRSISCQVDVENNNVIRPFESCDHPEKRMSIATEKLQVELPPAQRVQRSMSLTARQSRADRRHKDQEPRADNGGSLKRSSSVKGRADKTGKTTCKDEKRDSKKSEKKADKQKDKGFFSKLFGKKKKETDSVSNSGCANLKPGADNKPIVDSKPAVEYATFSAQFPPPEWLWYQQQLDRQLRTESWVQQQVAKAGTWHYLNKLSSESPSNSSVHMGPNSVPEMSSIMHATKPSQHFETKFGLGASRKLNKKSHKHKEKLPVVIANTPTESTRIDVDVKNTYRNSLGPTNFKLSSLPMRMSPAPSLSGEVLHSTYVTHPMFSSTPRFSTIHERPKQKEDLGQSPALDNHADKNQFKSSKTEKTKSQRRAHRSKRKSHHDRHSSYHPSSRHISGMSAHLALPTDTMDNDISHEYQGHLPNKHSAIGQSHSSGVNCMGLEAPNHSESHSQNHTQNHRKQRSNSYRHTVHVDIETHQPNQRSNSYRHVVNGKNHDKEPAVTLNSDNSCQGHIYANLHISEQEPKPKLPERTRRMKSKVHEHTASIPDESFCPPGRSHSPEIRPRFSLDLPESDRRSEHGSDRGTLTSGSSQGQSSLDSAMEGTESSEHSLGTVINTGSGNNHLTDNMVSDTQHLSLGDSGFSSPRVENAAEKRSESTQSSTEQKTFLCNNLKNEVRLNNSLGKLDDFSDDSFDRISSDRLYENVRISQKEVLNNMKYLQKEINVSSQNLNVPNTSAENGGSVEFDAKQAVAKKFNFEGDFHVVGVV